MPKDCSIIQNSSSQFLVHSNKYTRMGFGDNDHGGLQDFPDADFNKSLDEAFGSKSTPTRSTPARTKSGVRRHRARSPVGDNRSVGSKGSADGGGGITRKTSARGAGTGIGRQRSNRRASLAAAVNLMANASNGTSNSSDRSQDIYHHHSVEEHVSAARADRKVPRRAKHEERLQAAAMADHINLGALDLGYGDDTPAHTASSSNRRHHAQDLGYGIDASDGSNDYGYNVDAHQHNNNGHGERDRGGREKRSGRRQPGNEADGDRRNRFQQKGHGKSFDESFGNVRAQRSSRRRASLAGSSGPVQHTSSADDIHAREAVRTRRGRRASLVASEGAAAAAGTTRAEPSTRGIRESRSAARMRRASMAAGVAQDSFRGGGSIGSGFTEPEGMDNSHDGERQEWQEKRANKQKDMLERLRKSKEPEQPEQMPEPEEEDEPEPVPEPAVKPRARRRASLGILGMSSSNFAMVDNEDPRESRKEEKARKKEEKEKVKASKKTPSRTKSVDGGITAAVAAAGGGQRARAADRDRRRPGTMLDRIGT